MTSKQDIVRLFALIAAAYPKDTAFAAADELMRDMWHSMLKDLDYQLVEAALRAHIATSPFSPAVSDLRKWCCWMYSGSLDADQAWGYVRTAIRKYGIYNLKLARESMPAEVWQMVMHFGWGNLCGSDTGCGIERGQFLRMWEIQERRRRDRALLQPKILRMIEQAGRTTELPGEKVLEFKEVGLCSE